MTARIAMQEDHAVLRRRACGRPWLDHQGVEGFGLLSSKQRVCDRRRRDHVVTSHIRVRLDHGGQKASTFVRRQRPAQGERPCAQKCDVLLVHQPRQNA